MQNIYTVIEGSTLQARSELNIRQPWQGQSAVLDSITQVFDACGMSAERYPQLMQAAFVEVSDAEALRELLRQLQKNPALPVVLLTFHSMENAVEHSPALARIVRFPNVRSVVTTEFLAQAPTVFQKPHASLLSPEATRTGLETLRSMIRHDLGHALHGRGGYNKSALIERARSELGIQGEDQYVIDTVMATEKIEVDEFMDFPALCIDWQGTLFQEKSIADDLLSRARAEAKRLDLPVVIWTGGHVQRVYEELLAAGIGDIHVCSKQDCRGLRARKAIDDTPLADLRAEFGLDTAEFELV